MSREIEISNNLERVKLAINKAAVDIGRAPEEINLIVVTKTYPISDLEILYQLGIRDFGENREQEAKSKSPHLPTDVRWHYQGEVQSKKIKSLVEWASTIHSVDRVDHFLEFAKRAPHLNYLLQINLDPPGARAGRRGIDQVEFANFLGEIAQCPVKPAGVMGVAPHNLEAAGAFAELVNLSEDSRKNGAIGPVISAGMSNDYLAAIRAGATHLRIGSSILGVRS
jgi:pyridoxal phosphate enzyme (YggS family)